MALFLSDDWFHQVKTLSDEVGNLNLSPNLEKILINVKITDDTDTIIKTLHLKKGHIHPALDETAPSTVILQQATAQYLLRNFEVNHAIEAFINGDIRVEGDMSQLMALQVAQPTDEQKRLFDKIKSMTEL